MTWLSDRSGIASMGVAPRAHQPQPARPMYTATTMKRFFSDSSMSRLIMLASPEPRRISGEAGSHDTRLAVRAHGDTPQETLPGRHTDDCEWLKRGRRRAGRALERE